MSWSQLYREAARRHGAFDVRLAPAVGLTVDAVDARARREQWTRLYPRVVSVPGTDVSHRTRLAAAQLYLGRSAAAADLSAAWLRGLTTRPPALVHLLLPHERRAQLRGTIIRRSRLVVPSDRVEVDGISTLTPEFMLIVMAAHASVETLLSFAIDARQRGLLFVARLADRLAGIGNVPGRSRLGRLLWELSRDGSDSVFERRVRQRLREWGFTPSAAPVAVDVGGGRILHVDIAFPDQRVAIECQGLLAHRDRRRLDRNARRDNALALDGAWLVLKLTWDRFTHDWPRLAAELRATLDAR